MALFEGASDFVIHDGRFISNFYQLGPHDDSSQTFVRQLVEKDSSLNQYSADYGTVTIPNFSKSLLLQDLEVHPNVGRMNAGSCSFDLLARLGLFPGQPDEALANYDTEVPLDAVVSRGNCYCGRISRHGFVFLVSKYFQHVSMAETTNGGTCFILSTTIGRFKCYEIDDRTFIHFDSGTRSSYVDLIKAQNLDDILRTARGEFQIASGDDSAPNNGFEWRPSRSTDKPLESIASAEFYGVPNAVIYMTKSTLQRWKRVKEFGNVMMDTVLSVLDGLEEPVEFVSALRNLPPASDPTQGGSLPQWSTPAEKLASSILLYRQGAWKNISEASYKVMNTFAGAVILVILEAHKYFRSPRVELIKLISTSHDRFIRILNNFPPVDDLNDCGRLSKEYIRQELLTVVHTNKNNVALVAIQGLFAVLSQWNASRILLRARESPEEWIQFVGADDDELFMG